MKVIMNDDFFIKKGYQISNELALLDLQVIYNYLENESYWSKGISPEKLKTAISNSLCFGVYKQQTQIGFARVITDKATFAYICDVFILQNHRGKGLSKWLVQTIKAHPELQELKRWSLATADAHGLYAQFGFTPIVKADRWMEIFTPYQVQQ